MNWKTDEQMMQMAEQLGTSLTQMFDTPEFVPNPDGPPSPNPQRTIVKSVVYDAVDFTSLDPQKISDEFARMQRAAFATGEDGDAKAALVLAGEHISDWRGDAADAFAKQMTHIVEFMEQQERHVLVAAQAMGTAFGLAVGVRESYYSLAQNINVACQNVIRKQNEGATLKFDLAMGIEIVKTLTDLFGMEKIKDLKDWVIDKFLDLMSDAVEDKPIDGSGANQVLDSYLQGRDQLRRSFEDGLNSLRDWLNDQHWIYLRKPIPLLAPLPTCTDVDSPDFSYAKFFNQYHDPGAYASRVDQERKKYVEEKRHPDGIIHQRLTGQS